MQLNKDVADILIYSVGSVYVLSSVVAGVTQIYYSIKGNRSTLNERKFSKSLDEKIEG